MAQSYIERPIADYISDASSNRPAPGGGSVSSMVGALGMTMAEMALNFTIGKKKFADVEAEAKKLLEEVTVCRATCVACVDDDVAAYTEVSRAYGMPRNTPEEKAARSEAIQKALLVAMQPPLATFRAVVAVLPIVRRCADIANPNLISDVAVAAVHARAAMEGARLNVEINLAGMKDERLVAQVRDELGKGRERAVRVAEETLDLVVSRLKGD